MLQITVEKDGTGNFRTITEAVQSVPYGMPARVRIGRGVFEEKLYCEKRDILLEGSGAEQTVLRWADGALHTHADGTPTGTFRSYTAFLGGGRVCVARMTIENAAGDGAAHGQSLAVYADARRVYMEDVRLISHQDTLFCAPLPARERLPRGFYGPRAFTPRVPSRQGYRRCYIQGDIDFIFGGADAVFDECELVSRERGQSVNGYVTAPSGGPKGLGFVFINCRFTGACEPGTVYLGRPWRPYGKAALIGCVLGAHIRPEGWAAWDPDKPEKHATFVEFQCTGVSAIPSARVPWAKQITVDEAEALVQQGRALLAEVSQYKGIHHGRVRDESA